HVVMAIEEDTGSGAAAMGDNHRMPRCWPCGGLEAFRLQVGHQPVGSPLAVVGIGGIGGDGLDAEQRLEPLEALLKVGVGAGEGLLDIGSGGRHQDDPAPSWRTKAMRSMLVAPGVPRGMPAVMATRSPGRASPSW